MGVLAQSGLLAQWANQAALEGQVVTVCKDRLVAMVRTDFREALLKRL